MAISWSIFLPFESSWGSRFHVGHMNGTDMPWGQNFVNEEAFVMKGTQGERYKVETHA